MKKRNIIKLTLVRDKTDTYLKLWVAPEVEHTFKDMAVAQFGEAECTEISNKWFDDQKSGLKFYKNTTEMEKINSSTQDGYYAFNSFGKSLLDGNGKFNIALLRIVGASNKSGVVLRTNELIGYEELKTYVERLANWGKSFYRDYIKKSKMTAIIAYEM